MAEVAPAVLAESATDYQRDLARATDLSERIQIDLVDGEFADNRTINLIQAYWPDNVRADLHLMYDDPFAHTSTIISMHPHLVIVHAEAKHMSEERLADMQAQLTPVGIKLGVALLADTDVASAKPLLEYADHILVFTGELGHYGGTLRTDCLNKIGEAKALKPGIEAGVDGGINDTNAATVVAAGADVLNVGGYLQKAADPQVAYDKLMKELQI